MTLTRITDPRHPDYAAALALYAISFPLTSSVRHPHRPPLCRTPLTISPPYMIPAIL